VYVSRNPRPAGPAQIESNIETVGMKRSPDEPQGKVQKPQEIESFLVFEVLQRGHMAIRGQHQVTIGIGIPIQEEEGVAGAMKKEVLFVFFWRRAASAAKEATGSPLAA